jgi:hypothetical protein
MSRCAGVPPAYIVGGKMIRISIPFFYGLGASLRQLDTIVGGTTKLSAGFVHLYTAKRDLESLFAAEWLMPALRSAFIPGQNLNKAITPITDRTDFDAPITHIEAYNVKTAVQEFETVLRNEMAVSDCYFVTRKGGYDTSVLIANAEKCFPSELATKVPRAIVDIREAGKCLAFELNTASGFHILRATESVVRSYWDNVSKGKPHPRPKTLGRYLGEMEKKDFGSKKARAALKQITDLHRNPLMHPEETLSLEDAVGLFGICQSAISAMLKEIPPLSP